MKIILCYDFFKNKPPEARTQNQLNFLQKYLPLAGHNVMAVGFNGSPEKYAEKVRSLQPDLLWNVFHSFQGDAALSYMGALLLDDIAVPYAGCSAQTQLFAANRAITKTIFKEAMIPSAGHYALGDPDMPLPGTQWILKPMSGAGEEYPIKARTVEDLQKAIILKSFLGEHYAEQYIEGRQFYTALLTQADGSTAPVATGEIMPNKTVSFQNAGNVSIRSRIQSLALSCTKVFEIKGFAAISFVADSSGKVYVMDIDAKPLLTERSLFTQACTNSGQMDALRMISAIIRTK